MWIATVARSSVLLARTPRDDVEQSRTLLTDLPLAFKIALVRDDDYGEVVLVLDTQDLLLERLDLLIGGSRGDGVNKQETFARAHVLFAHGGVLLLSSRIEDIEQGHLVVYHTLLPIGVYGVVSILGDIESSVAELSQFTFDRRVVLVDKVRLYELDCER